jgi:hypothetical protein
MKTPRLVLLFCACVLPLLADTFTAKNYPLSEVRAALFAAGVKSQPIWAGQSYAQLSRAELTVAHAMFRRALSKAGVGVSPTATGWNKRFNCVAFAQRFVSDLQLALFREQFHVYSDAERPAAIPVGYKTRMGGCHCVLFVLTDRGAIWWDPQVGEVNLTPEEIASVFFPQA